MNTKSVEVEGCNVILINIDNEFIKGFHFINTQKNTIISINDKCIFTSLNDFKESIENSEFWSKDRNFLESLIPFQYKIKELDNEVLNEAVTALYFADKSDYANYLYRIICLITGISIEDIEREDIEQLYKTLNKD